MLDARALDAAQRRGFPAALRWLKDREAAKDACQEAAARVWQKRASFEPGRELYPWFYVVLRNACFDLRRRRRVDAVPLDESLAPSEPLSDPVEDRERSAQLRAALDALPAEHRAVIEARHFDELSYAEIALAFEVPEGTVMSRLFRARKLLRTELERRQREEEMSWTSP